MTHIVEDGTGVVLANAYAGESYVRNYLKLRGLNTTWDAATVAQRDAAIIAATQYIDIRWGPRFLGRKEHVDLDRPAQGWLRVLTITGLDGTTITIGSTVYTLVATLSSAFDVQIGASVAATVASLVHAINLTGTPGTDYHAATTIHPDVTGYDDEDGYLHVDAKVAGPDGNDIALATSDGTETLVNVGTTTLVNGEEAVEQPLEWPRINVLTRAGTYTDDVPDRVKQAMAEYALRALSAQLFTDPTINASGRTVVEEEVKVGPILSRTKFEEGGSLSQLIKPYPAADRLLAEYVSPPGGVIRG